MLSKRMSLQAVDNAASNGKIDIRYKLNASAQAGLQHAPQSGPGVKILSDLSSISKDCSISTEAEVARLSAERAIERVSRDQLASDNLISLKLSELVVLNLVVVGDEVSD